VSINSKYIFFAGNVFDVQLRVKDEMINSSG